MRIKTCVVLLILVAIVMIRPNLFSFSLQQVKTASLVLQEHGVLWSATYGGSDYDEAKSLVKCADEGFALAGYTNSFDESAVWLVRTGADGTPVWNQTYSGPNYESADSVALCGDGGFAIAGTIGELGDYDTLLIRTDKDGNQLWNKTYYIAVQSQARKILQCSDDGFAVLGFATSGAGDEYIFLLKTDANGNQLWGFTFGSSGHSSFGHSMVECVTGGFALIGYTDIYGGDYDGWLIRTNETGVIQWSQTYGGADADYCMGLAELADGGFAIAGVTGSYDVRAGDLWLLRTDSDGNLLWNCTYGGMHVEQLGSDGLLECGDGGFALAGYYYDEQSDLLLVRTDENGNQLWNCTYGGMAQDYGEEVVELGDGSFAVCGWTQSFGAGEYDAWLVRIGIVPTTEPTTPPIPGFPLEAILLGTLVMLGVATTLRRRRNEK